MYPIARITGFLLLASTSLLAPSCKTLEKGRDGALLGAAAGGSIGALVGKKAGNPSIGATIGAALGGSTGAFLSKKLYKSANLSKPIYVLNGTLYKGKTAKEKLSGLTAERVESVKVLNIDEATALYGNKGENGAILINYKTPVTAATASLSDEAGR